MTNQNNAAPAAAANPLSDEYVNAVIQQHGYQSPEAVAARLFQWIGRHGGENGVTLLIYEAHKALSKLRAPVADERAALHHVANEWADMATSAIQWVRNIKDGISTPDAALENLMSNLTHCREVQSCAGIPTALASAPVAGEAQERIEQMALSRYRTVPCGQFSHKVVAGDGSRSLHVGPKGECLEVAAHLTEAFLDGAFVASSAAPQASEAVRDARGVLEAWQAVCDRIVDQYGGVVAGVDFAALGRANRAALSAQPGAQKYWLCCGSKDPNHPNRRAPDCFNATRAKWGAADQHSAAHPKQHNDGGAD